jgi:hypothetical protein
MNGYLVTLVTTDAEVPVYLRKDKEQAIQAAHYLAIAHDKALTALEMINPCDGDPRFVRVVQFENGRPIREKHVGVGTPSLVGEYALDDNRRVARRRASWSQAMEALRYYEQSGDKDGAARLRAEMEVLLGYWDRPDTTKDLALTAYNTAHM